MVTYTSCLPYTVLSKFRIYSTFLNIVSSTIVMFWNSSLLKFEFTPVYKIEICGEKLFAEKNRKLKISWHCSFKSEYNLKIILPGKAKEIKTFFCHFLNPGI